MGKLGEMALLPSMLLARLVARARERLVSSLSSLPSGERQLSVVRTTQEEVAACEVWLVEGGCVEQDFR